MELLLNISISLPTTIIMMMMMIIIIIIGKGHEGPEGE